MKRLATFVPDACGRVSDHSLEDDEDRGEVAAGQEGENDGVASESPTPLPASKGVDPIKEGVIGF